MRVTNRNTSENPFYGKKAMLAFLQQAHKSNKFDASSEKEITALLNACYSEVSTIEDEKLLLSLIFSVGDINNREHNIFTKEFAVGKVDGGGNGARYAFIHCLNWLLGKNKKTKDLFYKSLHLITEYTNFENLFLNQVRTDRKTGKLLAKIKVDADPQLVAEYLAKMIKSPKTPDIRHQILSKFLPNPKFVSKRTRTVEVTEKNKKNHSGLSVGSKVNVKKSIQTSTLKVRDERQEFIEILSKEVGWEVVNYPHNKRFVGLEQYKAKYNKTTEAVLFSTKNILKFTKDQFVAWLDKQPSDARFRVQCRLFKKEGKTDKLVSRGKWIAEWGDLATGYTAWEKGKEVAQEVLRTMPKEQKEKLSSSELKEFEKAAKVNVGSTKMIDLFVDLFKGGNSNLNIRAQSILDKMKMEVPALIITDVSGSMSSVSASVNGVSISAQQVAKLVTTTFLLKNPSEELSSFFVRFDDRCEVIHDKSMGIEKANRFMQGKEVLVEKLIDKKEDFTSNYNRVSTHIMARGGTSFNTVSRGLKDWASSSPEMKSQRIEHINKYPVFLVISDGDMNNASNPAESMRQFKQEMLQFFGWDGVVVVWDVKQQERQPVSKFENIENVIYFGGFNEGILNQVFCNLSDIDVIDVYTPLLSLYRTNRYEPVRALLDTKVSAKKKVLEETI